MSHLVVLGDEAGDVDSPQVHSSSVQLAPIATLDKLPQHLRVHGSSDWFLIFDEFLELILSFENK